MRIYRRRSQQKLDSSSSAMCPTIKVIFNYNSWQICAIISTGFEAPTNIQFWLRLQIIVQDGRHLSTTATMWPHLSCENPTRRLYTSFNHCLRHLDLVSFIICVFFGVARSLGRSIDRQTPASAVHQKLIRLSLDIDSKRGAHHRHNLLNSNCERMLWLNGFFPL